MALPDGIGTCTVMLGKALDSLGVEATIKASITTDRPIVWAATGDTIYSTRATVDAGDASASQFALAHVDQPGFVDAAGDAVTYWAYIVRVTADFPDGSQEIFEKGLQVFVGQDVVDLALVPDDSIVPGVTAPSASVLSVAGFTGAVTLEALAETLSDDSSPLGDSERLARADEVSGAQTAAAADATTKANAAQAAAATDATTKAAAAQNAATTAAAADATTKANAAQSAATTAAAADATTKSATARTGAVADVVAAIPNTGTAVGAALAASTDARIADPASPSHQTIQGIALVNALVYGG